MILSVNWISNFTYSLFFFRSTHLYHHLTRNMTLWLVRYSTFFFAWHPQGNVKKKKWNVQFLNYQDVIFLVKWWKRKGSWKITTCKMAMNVSERGANSSLFCCCFWMTPMAFWMTPMAKGKWWISSSSWVFLRLGHCQLTSPVVVVYSSTAAVCILYYTVQPARG